VPFAISAVNPHDPHVAAGTEGFAGAVEKDDAVTLVAVRILGFEITVLAGVWDGYSAHGKPPQNL
jgi:hypothetical protein